MKQIKLLCKTQHPLQVLGEDGVVTIIPEGKTLTLLDAYTQEDDTNIAVVICEDDEHHWTAEVVLDHILPHIACEKVV